jgi:hypothetical protein
MIAAQKAGVNRRSSLLHGAPYVVNESVAKGGAKGARKEMHFCVFSPQPLLLYRTLYLPHLALCRIRATRLACILCTDDALFDRNRDFSVVRSRCHKP